MKDWKELEIDNLPSDILTGGYEWEWRPDPVDDFDEWKSSNLNMESIIKNIIIEKGKYRYRKPEPKQPTHLEIMTKWWKIDDQWWKVLTFDAKNGMGYFIESGQGWIQKEEFANIESADIPPEGEV